MPAMAYKNIEESRAAIRRHYYANKSKYLEKNRKRREQMRAFVRELKEASPCTDCGNLYPYYIMDFDHLENKEGLISFYTKNGSLALLRQELAKCELVCANCHRRRTFLRQNAQL